MSEYKTKLVSTTAIVIFAVVVTLALAASTVFAALTLQYGGSQDVEVATMSSTFQDSGSSTGCIKVTTEVPCVMRVAPKTETGRTLLNGSSMYTAQYNGWYYYNAVIPVGTNTLNAANNANNLVGANVTSANLWVELMQAQYSVTGSNSGGGFIVEWADGANASEDEGVSSKTTDGVTITSSVFSVLFNGTELTNSGMGGQSQRSLSVSSGDFYYNETQITSSKPLRVYNNSPKALTISIQVTNGETYNTTLTQSITSLGTWGTFERSAGGSSSTYYFLTTPVNPGTYYDLISTQTTTAGDTTFNITISALDADSFYKQYIKGSQSTYITPYYSWLTKLGSSYVTAYDTYLGGGE